MSAHNAGAAEGASSETTAAPQQRAVHRTRFAYIPALDGIRAIAVLGVILVHTFPGALPGGFVGVDVFFVLSGFLIISIILHDLKLGTFSLREFYLRRVQRLFPNLAATVLVTVVLWVLLLPPGTAVPVAQHALWSLFSAANVYVWKFLGNYWGDTAETAPLTHTWSLGVEEQFYLLFPTLLVLLWRRRAQRPLTALSLIAVASFAVSLAASYIRPLSAFYLLPARIWELLIGGLIAAAASDDPDLRPFSSWSEPIVTWLGILGLGLVLGSLVLIAPNWPFPGTIALAPTLGTGLVIVSVAQRRNGLSALLGSRPLAAVGKVSYSLYLWHWPLITLGRAEARLRGIPEWKGALAGAVAGVLLALLAYFALERPLRRTSRANGARFAIAALAYGTAILGCLFFFLFRPVVDEGHRFETPVFYNRAYDAGWRGFTSGAVSARYLDVSVPSVPPTQINLWRTGGIIRNYGGPTPELVVLGSSHALMYSHLIDEICRAAHISVAFLGADCGNAAFFRAKVTAYFPTVSRAREFDQRRLDYIRRWRPDAVMVIDRWDGNDGFPDDFEAGLTAFHREVGPFTRKIIVVCQVPVLKVDETVNLRGLVSWYMRKYHEGLPALFPDRMDAGRRQMAETATQLAGRFDDLIVLRPDLRFYNRDGSVRYAEGRRFYYIDDNHLSESGAQLAHDMFARAILSSVTLPSPRTLKSGGNG